MKDFNLRLQRWYAENKRVLPWRESKDPYKIWLSEVILQQTRVEQGLAYWHRFVSTFPSVELLARAKEDQVLKFWQGLGYYSRARNLHAAAKQIVKENRKGKKGKILFPESYAELVKLKGVGIYTASAIASICFNEAKAVVDGNVYRVLSRLFGLHAPIDEAQGKKEFQLLADSLLNKKNPGDHNQAMMEFGAKQCVPKNPNCEQCPFIEWCVAYRKKLVSDLPKKSRKTKVRARYFYYFVFESKGKFFIRKRANKKDIWHNLWEFALAETPSDKKEKEIPAMCCEVFYLNKRSLKFKNFSSVNKHVLSHQILFTRFVQVELLDVKAENRLKQMGYAQAGKKRMIAVAWPRLIEKYLSERSIKSSFQFTPPFKL